MATGPTYRDFWSNPVINEAYIEYQRRYASQVRESDRVLIELVREVIGRRVTGDGAVSLLDIGCSTGNLLHHLREALPGLDLWGGDIVGPAIEQCKVNPNLSGIRFEEMDLMTLGRSQVGRFDVIVANAVLYVFNDGEFARALSNLSEALKPGGWFIAFDLYHPFEQNVSLLERSRLHPEGHQLHFRPYSEVQAALEANQFGAIRFTPFAIPIDLPKPDDPADIRSYTVGTSRRERLIFRGVLNQPWCHMLAQKLPAA
jgi:SAM-dependent methyltransferase